MKFAMALILLQFYGNGCDFGGIGADDDDDFGNVVVVQPPPPPREALPSTATIILATSLQEHFWTSITQWENSGDSLLVEGFLSIDTGPRVTTSGYYDGCSVEMIIVEPLFDDPLTCKEETDP